MVVQNLEDGLGNFSLVLVVRVEPNLHFGFADRHEADCKARTHTGEAR